MKLEIRLTKLAPYAVAVLCVLSALALHRLLMPVLGPRGPMIGLSLSAIVAAWFGGLGPGLFALVAGQLLANYLFLQPGHSWLPVGTAEWVHGLLYDVVTGSCIGIIEALRRARRRAQECYRLAQSRGEQLRASIREIGEAEAKIRELAEVVESAHDAILSVARSGQIKSWNAGAERLFGYASAEMIGQPLAQLLPADCQAEQQGPFERLKRGETVEAFETFVLTKDGKRSAVSIRLSPLNDAAGKIVGASAIIRDVTDLKRTRAALRESEQRFQLLSSTAPLMIWMADPQQRCTWVNGTRLAFTGRAPEQETGEGWLEAMHEEDRARWQQAYATASETHQSFQSEYRLRRSDGVYRWVLDQGVPHFSADGTFLGYLGTSMDVDERKKAEEALEAKFDELRTAQDLLQAQNQELGASRRAVELERSRYQELFNSAPIGYILTNSQGVIQQVNHAASELLRDSPEFLVGLPLARLLAREERATFFANLGRLTRHEVETIESWETLVQPHNQPAFPCLMLVNLIHGPTHRLTGLRWMLRDITDRKQAEEKALRLKAELEQRVRERTAALEAANHELEAFSYSVSHDLRAPLRSILGFSKALLEEYGSTLDEQGLKYLHYAQEAGLRMNRLIEDLMELSRATRGELRQKEVDLSALATLVIAELRKRDPLREVEVEIAPALRVQGDEGLLRIALENLLGNAWKFTARQARARIELGATERLGSRLFFVKDNGAGFSMANANRLFGVFQRLHSQEEFPGTGIGLATVRRIFARHGGEIWAEGKPGEGATFYFTLPEFGPLTSEGQDVQAAALLEPQPVEEGAILVGHS